MFSDFLEELKQKEITVSFTGGKIKYSGPAENITPELLRKLREFKGDLMRHLWPIGCKNLIAVSPEGNKIPIILIYCNNIMYSLAETLGPDQPIYGFFDEGWLTGKKNMYKSIESIATDYILQLKKVLPNGPYYLGGHSLGGNIAYEMAVQLQRAGNEVPLLFVLDTRASSLIKFSRWNENMNHNWKIILRPLIKNVWQYIKMPYFHFIFLLKKSIEKKTRRRSYIVTNYQVLLDKYRPEKFKGGLLLFRAEIENHYQDYDYGWERLVSKVTFADIMCTHQSIVKEKDKIEIIGKEIEMYLEDSRELQQMIS